MKDSFGDQCASGTSTRIPSVAALEDKIECKMETWRVAGCNVISVVFVEQEETAIIVYLFCRRGILAFINCWLSCYTYLT